MARKVSSVGSVGSVGSVYSEEAAWVRRARSSGDVLGGFELGAARRGLRSAYSGANGISTTTRLLSTRVGSLCAGL